MLKEGEKMTCKMVGVSSPCQLAMALQLCSDAQPKTNNAMHVSVLFYLSLVKG
jgi:hypothetical protein